MTRDELILTALTAGDAATVDIAAAAGLQERTVRAGLLHLRKEGLVIAPERGRYRLTGLGHRVTEEGAEAGSGRLRPASAAPAPAVATVREVPRPPVTEPEPGLAGTGLGLIALGLTAIAAIVWLVILYAQGDPEPPAADPPRWDDRWSW